ncbi:hypothetical protein COCSUDRAFT_67693 [Coccomyxa subellipsoidea C-169]|uniref:THIF-type NAD/FAD binding fold domain-containing protein n=1 Tax=Coccomyxa subellipsoidea (strain C-169) TaxID=574566 RepID=I0YMC4_COCSC|nr:hypothetical protein COCSUDRAFT_67693 [Coccomyxa subellipsoidea C-169]EIE19543.1 hypothetical protein COCSUDRAFT_67693 [Coccomyxa subellipsoidea C-169]|eukprot:XP_005644087.1 hypothetical protein COCSUDRAFT_67693 [Coccomyxa subellipsoidea C-169]
MAMALAAHRAWGTGRSGEPHREQLGSLKQVFHHQHPPATSTSSHSLEDDIVAEHFTRNVQFFGREAQQKIMGSFVVVVGLGGVGSHAAHLLLRSGVGRLRLIDFDQVSLSSLNRHAVATRADVGMPKATCLQEHFRRMVPEARVEALVQMYTAEDEDALLDGAPDYVIDAIDNIDTKISLLAACNRRGIPVICVAGAGAKADPTRIRIADVSDSIVDPLARAVRQRLRRDHSIEAGIPIVLSTEKPRCTLVPIQEVGDNPLDYQIVPNFRVRTIPVLGTLPAMFGLAAASHVLCELASAPFAPEPVFRLLEAQYQTQLDRLTEREDLVFNNAEGPSVDLDDVIYLVREVWRGLSAKGPPYVLSGGDKGFKRSLANLTLTRWDKECPATVDNLVLLTFGEAEQHEEMRPEDVKTEDPNFFRRVQQGIARVLYIISCTAPAAGKTAGAKFNSSDLSHLYTPVKAAVDGLIALGGEHVADAQTDIKAAANHLVQKLHKGKGETPTPRPSNARATPTLQPSTTPSVRYPSTLTLTATPAAGVATEAVTFLVTLRSTPPGAPVLAGKPVSIDFGDGSHKRRRLLAAIATTGANGQATFTHSYLTAQTYNVTAAFAGDASSGDVAASLSLVISLESTSLSLTVAPKFLKPLQNASHSITLQFGGPGPASKAGYQIFIDYQDGTTETVVTDSNGQAFPVHAYIRFSNPAFNVTASFAGDGTYAGSTAAAASVVVRDCSAACSGNYHACAIRLNTTLECFGDNNVGQLDIPAPNAGFIGVSCGGGVTCAIRSDTTLVCVGQFYRPPPAANQPPTVPQPATGFAFVSVGFNFVCAIRFNSSLECWGDNRYGQLNIPAPATDFVAVSAGLYQTCAIKSDTTLLCWGAMGTFFGQPVNFGQTTVPLPATGFVAVDSGTAHTCAIRSDATLVCFGSSEFYPPTPQAGIVAVSCGDVQTVALRSNTSLMYAQFESEGGSQEQQYLVPSPNSGFVGVYAGDAQTCAIRIDTSFQCWVPEFYGSSPVYDELASMPQPVNGFGAPCLYQ